MADQTGSLTCPICFEAYTAATDQHDRRPTIICKNGHTLCSTCAISLDKCPTCRESKALVLNRALLDIVAERHRQKSTPNDAGIPEIAADHVKLAARPFAGGAYADLYDATWQKQSVALKVLRQHVVTTRVLHDVLEEARLAMSLNHPNIVRVFGVVSIDGGKGLLMEKADRGSLRSALDANNKLSLDQLASVSIDIVDGLEYIHSKQMVHRDLKPENVLLFDIKSRLTAKAADFGTSKVVQATLANTTMVGSPYYMAPELFQTQKQARYNWKVDLYSLAIVLYEVFSGRTIGDAYGCENPMQLAMRVASGQRPEMAKSFPAELRTVIDRGWSADADVRPTLAAYREALRKLNETSTRNFYPTASVRALFEAQLLKLELSTNAYKLEDARRQVEACWTLWMRFDNQTTATASTARYHSVKGYVHHWFGEISDAYAETYQALTELHKLCLSGTSVEGEQVAKILRYAVEVCWSQDQHKAAVMLFNYAVRYTNSKLSAAAYADMLECFGYFRYYDRKIIYKFVLSTRLRASAQKKQIDVATAHYYLAKSLAEANKNYSSALKHIKEAIRIISQVDPDNIWAAACKSLNGELLRLSDKNKIEEAKQLQEDAFRIAKRILGKNNQTVSDIYRRLAFAFKDLKNFQEAERMFQKAIKTAENSLGQNSIHVQLALECLASTCTYELKKYQEAEKLYLRSVDVHKSVFGPGYWKLSYLYEKLAITYTKWGQTDKAATYYRWKSEVKSGKLEYKLEKTIEVLEELKSEVSSTLQSGNQVSEAPDQLTDVLTKFLEVAPKPQHPQLQSATLNDEILIKF